jgi:hypothetical protein
MNKVLQLLQRLGEDASLRNIATSQLPTVLNPLNLDSAVQQAIFEKDDAMLARLLDTTNKIVCMIFPAEEPAPQDQPADVPAKQPADTPEPAEYDIKQVV